MYFGSTLPITGFSNDAQKTVAAAGTAEQLTSTFTPCLGVVIQALRANTGVIAVGGSSVLATGGGSPKGITLAKGDTITYFVDSVSRIYIDASVNAEGVSYSVLQG